MNLPQIKKILFGIVGPILALAFVCWTNTIPRPSTIHPEVLWIGIGLVAIDIGGMMKRTRVPGPLENAFWLFHTAICLLWMANTPKGWSGNILTPILGLTMCMMMFYRYIVPPKKSPKKTQP